MGRGVRCVLCRFVYARETIRPGRAVMHASVSVEYECDVSLTATAAIDAAAATNPRFTSLEYCLTCFNMRSLPLHFPLLYRYTSLSLPL
jgi:hypothetical protein